MGQTPSTESTTEFTHESGLGLLNGLTFHNSDGVATCHRLTRIRFSEPVTGQNRWRKPVPLPSDYDYTGSYKDFGLPSPQPGVTTPPMDKVYYRKAGDEDTNTLNVWIPASDRDKPESGWPVLVYLFGGFLKYGAPSVTNAYHPNHLFDDDNFADKCIIVAPAYRINLFGFLASEELLERNGVLNCGFWDQRLAIEWVYENIEHFGGDKEKLIVGGVSAGAYAAFFQAAYELYHPNEPQYIKRLALFSNSIFIQPKTVEEQQVQFDELLDKLGIDKRLSLTEKMQVLESVDAEQLVDQINLMQNHTFRAVTDDDFVSHDVLKDVASGQFGRLMAKKGMELLIGETSNEGSKYATFNSPTSIDDLKLQVLNFYPQKICDLLFSEFYHVDKINPHDMEAIKDTFGRIVADGQVYNSSRGLINGLIKGGFPQDQILRYQVDYLNDYYKPRCPAGLVGVPHGLDVPHWFYGLDDGITPEEAAQLKIFLVPYTKWLNFRPREEVNWGTSSYTQLRKYTNDGSTAIVHDDRWDWGIKVTDAVYRAQ